MQYKTYHSISLFFLIVSLSRLISGMEIVQGKLNSIEKAIFLDRVKNIGITSIKNEIAQTPHISQQLARRHGVHIETLPCLTIILELRPTEHDPLTQSIVQKITKKEFKEAYRPKTVINEEQNNFFIPNNFLGYHTQYWHKTDQNGPYIKSVSTFYDTKELEEILAQQ